MHKNHKNQIFHVQNVLQCKQVKNVSKAGNSTGIEIFVRYFKHSKHETFTLFIPKQTCIFCPVKALHAYLHLRPKQAGPLFIFQDGNPISSS